jgi:hypothetical protein
MICREIVEGDLDDTVDLLTRGFRTQRSRAFWERAVSRLAEREPPPGLPRFGYALVSGDAVVGVLLVISSAIPDGNGTSLRCNMSSWYVEPDFRSYGTLLERRALRHREATYLNVTPAPHTRPGLLAQGYSAYAGGRAITAPALSRNSAEAQVIIATPGLVPGGDLSAGEVRLLVEHASWGCISLVCVSGGQRFPFVFARRRRHALLPFAYLLYCREIGSFVRFAGPIGRFLAKRGMLLVAADTSGALRGVPGMYLDGYPKYYRGSQPPCPSDLAYTERAVFGV